MRGFDIVFKQEQPVNRFMDDRPHSIDGQSGKVPEFLQNIFIVLFSSKSQTLYTFS
jgi:hypothetical protein